MTRSTGRRASEREQYNSERPHSGLGYNRPIRGTPGWSGSWTKGSRLRLRHPEVPHHAHVFVLEDVAVIEVLSGMFCEFHLHANRLAG